MKPAGEQRDGYAWYALGVLTLVYVFNFLDRQILSILAEHIRHDLGVNDAQLGFLYGTAFAVFYAVFGIPLGRLADTWDRRKLIALGLAAWSGMTALSGMARSFPERTTSAMSSGSPGSSTGLRPALMFWTFFSSTSTPRTSWPASARHAADTDPT